MKAFTTIIVTAIIAILVAANFNGLFALDETSLFLTLIGLIYALHSAFTINHVWSRYIEIRELIGEETSSLLNVYLASQFLSDKKIKALYAEKIANYCMYVANTSWKGYADDENAHEKFNAIYNVLGDIKIKNSKDANLFDDITDNLTTASNARIKQLVLERNYLGGLNWALLIFVSLVLLVGMFITSLESHLLTLIIGPSLVVAVTIIIVIIRKFDTLEYEFVQISEKPYKQLAEHLRKYESVHKQADI